MIIRRNTGEVLLDVPGDTLSGADLRGVDLSGADLSGVNLSGVNLSYANLSGVNLRGVKTDDWTRWPHFQICPPTGKFVAWKKLRGGVIAKLEIPSDAQRTSSLVGRKCRGSRVKVLGLSGGVTSAESVYGGTYRVGKYTVPDAYDPDPKVECTNGIHFFVTEEEAREW